MSVKLEWSTPDIDERIAFMARVSNVRVKRDEQTGLTVQFSADGQSSTATEASQLIKYLIDHKHWSPLEMANICFDIETTRDISRQILRHRSSHFQEFSQRYAEVEQEEPVLREARLQDPKNRQNSLKLEDELSLDDEDSVRFLWRKMQYKTWDVAEFNYRAALELGIAKEQARALLPEGLTKTRMFVNGTIRDWFHYLCVRTGPETQLEHRELAKEILEICMKLAPATFGHVKNV